jgi:hypothetical protein
MGDVRGLRGRASSLRAKCAGEVKVVSGEVTSGFVPFVFDRIRAVDGDLALQPSRVGGLRNLASDLRLLGGLFGRHEDSNRWLGWVLHTARVARWSSFRNHWDC